MGSILRRRGGRVLGCPFRKRDAWRGRRMRGGGGGPTDASCWPWLQTAERLTSRHVPRGPGDRDRSKERPPPSDRHSTALHCAVFTRTLDHLASSLSGEPVTLDYVAMPSETRRHSYITVRYETIHYITRESNLSWMELGVKWTDPLIPGLNRS